MHLALSSAPAAAPALDRRTGHGRIDVARSHDRSVVTRAFAASPLKLLTPRNHGHAAWVYTSSYGGGLVDGDRLSMRVVVGKGAALVLATQASTKVYRSPRGTGAGTGFDLHADIGPNALCLAAPDPIVCFAGSRYRQEQRLDLAADAALVLVDWMTSGRRAAGERWAFDEYATKTSVRIAGRRVIYDSVALRATDGPLPERLGRFEVLATVVLAGLPLVREAAAIVTALSALPIERRADLLMTAAAVGHGAAGSDATGRDAAGCVVRIAGTSVEAVGFQIRHLLSFLPAMLGDDPWSRKW